MANSVINSAIFSAVLSSMPALTKKLVVFDTVVGLTEQLRKPVDFLLGVQLGGGTEIAKAMHYCENLVES